MAHRGKRSRWEVALIRPPLGDELPIRRFTRTISAKPTGADQCRKQQGFPAGPAGSRHWQRRGGTDRRVRPEPAGQRHPLRGGFPARRPRPHPRRAAAGRPRPGRRHRLHRPQRADLSHAAAALRRARRRNPGLGNEHVRPLRRLRPGIRRRPGQGPRHHSPAVHPAARPLPADAAGGHALLPPGPRPAGRGDTATPDDRSAAASRADPGGVPGPGEVQQLLHLALHDPDGERRLVLRPHHRAGLPGPLPLHVPGPPRPARRHGLAAVADRHRRLAQLRGQARRHTAGHPPRQPRSPACAGTRTAWS